MLCPFCHLREANSRDHIFPQFLGGELTILACVQCNNRFGHTFEGDVFKLLESLMTALAASHLNLPKRKRGIVWREAYRDKDGVMYDFHPHHELTPSRIASFEDGNTINFAGVHERDQAQFRRQAEAKGREAKFWGERKFYGELDL